MKKTIQIILILCVNPIFSQQVEYKVNKTSINSSYAELGTIYLNNNAVLFASSKKNIEDKPFKKK